VAKENVSGRESNNNILAQKIVFFSFILSIIYTNLIFDSSKNGIMSYG